MFLIYDEDNDVVIFAGRMVNPKSVNNASSYFRIGSRILDRKSDISSCVEFVGHYLLSCFLLLWIVQAYC